MVYDSTYDTKAHIRRVGELIMLVRGGLFQRAKGHDASKLKDPEKAIFDEYTPKLKDSTYGSEEYNGFLKGMGEGLSHHYENNRHHPEHFAEGILGMNLVDLLEMLCDWKAASERHANGDLMKSIEINAGRFGYCGQVKQILINTAKALENA